MCQEFFSQGGVPGQVHPSGPGTLPRTRYTPLQDQVHPGRYTPLDQVHPPWDQVLPPRPGTPPKTRYPPDQVPPQDQVHPPRPGIPPGTRYPSPPGPGNPPDQVPPGRYTPSGAVHAGRCGQQVDGTHPTGMHSCYYMKSSFALNQQEFFLTLPRQGFLFHSCNFAQLDTSLSTYGLYL